MHVAIIMDGNGRWAERRGLRRTAGHRAGARAVRRVVEAAVHSGIDVLTLYAFSSDNWHRPAHEVANLMQLFKLHLLSEAATCVENGVRVVVIGRRDRLRPDVVRSIKRIERATSGGRRLTLQIAIDYSARDAIARAARLANGVDDDGASSSAVRCFGRQIGRAINSPVSETGVDLLIRTGGERRLSDFLLWECAYAELVFVDECWPDFDEHSFAAALGEFRRRERRFGGLPAPGTGQFVHEAPAESDTRHG